MYIKTLLKVLLATIGLLHNITISLKSVRPNKTEIKIVPEKKLVYISTRAQKFSLYHPMTTIPTPNPLSHRHCWETNFEILLIIANKSCRRNVRFPVHNSSHRKFQKCASRVLIRPGSGRLGRVTYPLCNWSP